MRGRRAPGPEFVRRLVGGADAKERLEVILQTLTGQVGIKQASARLGITPQRLHTLRQVALQGALTALAPQPLGRPRQRPSPEQEQIDDLEHRLEELQHELDCGPLRAQIAVLLPGRSLPGEKKRGTDAGPAPGRGRGRARRR